MLDQALQLADAFPEHHWIFGPGVDLDADYRDDSNQLQHRRRQFGNMLLTRAPILSSRNYLLPKHGLTEALSLQRCALEGLIAASSEPLRIYTTHLAHASAAERQDQITLLLSIIRNLPLSAGVWSAGSGGPTHWTETGQPPPVPARAFLMGDFNLTPFDAEYDLLVGKMDPARGRLTRVDTLVDAWVGSNSGPVDQPTCVESALGNRPQRGVRLDYLFVTPDLSDSVKGMTIDETAQGSDHQPIFAEIEI